MRLVNIDSIEPGTRLGEPIHGTNGQLLLQRGFALNNHYVCLLRQMGYPALYVLDDDTSDIAVPQPVSTQTRMKVLGQLNSAFATISKRTEGFRESSRSLARTHLKSERFAVPLRSLAIDAGIDRLVGEVDVLLNEALQRDVLLGLNSIKTHDQYTFQHSIDVTIMGLVLAKKAGWDAQRLRAFGIGCILHDIGKIFIDSSILNKAGPLTAEEFELMRAHPVVGHELILAIAPALGYLPPQVAYQHHEREDGSGYPRRLRGSPNLEQHASGAIHEFGALSAVADIYDALTSHRSYRPSWAPDRAARFIASLSDIQLNRQAVDLFTSVVAPYPVCTDVRVCNGPYAGYVGVVSHVPEQDLSRPTVRLMSNAYGQRISPVELNLQVERDVNVQSIVRTGGQQPLRRIA